MRMLALPAAYALSFLLYLLFPRAEGLLADALERLHRRMSARMSEARALFSLLLMLAAAASLLGALHPLAAALVMTPLFTAPAVLPGCAQMKHDLDSGRYVRNIPVYEENVRVSCMSLAPAFLCGAVAPMLVCAVGMPLYIGFGLGWAYLALRHLHGKNLPAQRALVVLLRTADKVFSFMLLLCSGVVGRNPLHSRGRDAKSHLLSILGIAGDGADTHAPVAGDIPQGIFLCCFCTSLLCFTLTAVGFVLC